MKLSLVVSHGKIVGQEIPIRFNQFLIGRDPECHLRPASPMISKRHCAVYIREERVFLRDFGSTNGTTVNDQPVKGEVELKEGDEIKVGPLSFRVKLGADVAAEAAAPAKAAPKRVAAAPTPQAVSANSQDNVDEDSVLEMLLNLQENPDAAVKGEAIPSGSTVMNIFPATSDAEVDTDRDKSGEKKPDKKAAQNQAATSDAAKAILEKYMRRPRS